MAEAIDTGELFAELNEGSNPDAAIAALSSRPTLEDAGVTEERVELVAKWAEQVTRCYCWRRSDSCPI